MLPRSRMSMSGHRQASNPSGKCGEAPESTQRCPDITHKCLRLSVDILLSARTDQTYNDILEAQQRLFGEDCQLLSHYQVKAVVSKLSGVVFVKTHMCVKKCLAYTGPFSQMDLCPSCGSPRCMHNAAKPDCKEPQQTVTTLLLGPMVQAFRRHPETAKRWSYLRHRIEEIKAKIVECTTNTNTPFEVEIYDDFCWGTTSWKLSTMATLRRMTPCCCSPLTAPSYTATRPPIAGFPCSLSSISPQTNE